jgi:hypothetical protein
VPRDPSARFWEWLPPPIREAGARLGFGTWDGRGVVFAADGFLWVFDGRAALCAAASSSNVDLDETTSEMVTIVEALLRVRPTDDDVPVLFAPVQIDAQVSKADRKHRLSGQGIPQSARSAPCADGNTIVAWRVGDVVVAPDIYMMSRAVFGSRLVWATWRGYAVARLGAQYVAVVKSASRPPVVGDDLVDDLMSSGILSSFRG